LQETFVTAGDIGVRFRWMGVGFFYWLRGIAHNKLRTFLRQRNKERRSQVPLEQILPWIAAPDEVSAQLEIQERLQETRAKIRHALASLKERDQQVIRMRLMEKKSRQDAAGELGISVAHLDVLLFRAVRRFRNAYQKEG
jgi:RNA polymerase sigma factor (sigma-70 family)